MIGCQKKWVSWSKLLLILLQGTFGYVVSIFENPSAEARAAAADATVELYKIDKKLTKRYVANVKPQTKEILDAKFAEIKPTKPEPTQKSKDNKAAVPKKPANNSQPDTKKKPESNSLPKQKATSNKPAPQATNHEHAEDEEGIGLVPQDK